MPEWAGRGSDLSTKGVLRQLSNARRLPPQRGQGARSAIISLETTGKGDPHAGPPARYHIALRSTWRALTREWAPPTIDVGNFVADPRWDSASVLAKQATRQAMD